MANMLSDFVEDDDGTRYTQKAAQALQPVARAPYDFSDVEAGFLNGDNLDSPSGGLEQDAVGVPGGGKGNKIATSGQIELVHFGRVYLDAQAKFAHPSLDDQDPSALQGHAGARAIAHRAALQRELVLLGGYLRALQSTMDAAGKTPPEPDGSTGDPLAIVQSMLGMAGSMLGGPTSPSVPQASTLDTQPLVAQAEAIAKLLDRETIRYENLHAAGVAIHELRAKYQAFLREQHALLPTGPDPAANKGSLTELPFVGEFIAELPVLGEVLGWASKIAGVSFGLCARMAIELHLQMEGNIDAACCAVSVDAIRQRRTPLYDVWFPPPQAANQAAGPGPGWMPAVAASAYGAVDRRVSEVRDFFAPNPVTAPGEPFLDQVFGVDRSADLWLRSQKAGDMGGSAIRSLLAAVDESIAPPIVADITGYIFRLVSEFVRALYRKLLVVGNDGFSPDDLLEAARHHIGDALAELPFKYLDFMRTAREASIRLPSPTGGAPIVIDGHGLVFQAKELFTKHSALLNKGIEFAIADVYEELRDARLRAGSQSASMEAYLAILPDLHARMFRNLILPFWAAMEGAMSGAFTAMLRKALRGATGAVGKAHHIVDKADRFVARGQTILGTPLQTSARTANADRRNWEALFTRGVGESDDPWAHSPGQVSVYGTTFPQRKTKGQALLGDDEVRRVADRHKYRPDAPPNEPEPSPHAKPEPSGAAS